MGGVGSMEGGGGGLLGDAKTWGNEREMCDENSGKGKRPSENIALRSYELGCLHKHSRF
jgi:hypothetical protein